MLERKGLELPRTLVGIGLLVYFGLLLIPAFVSVGLYMLVHALLIPVLTSLEIEPRDQHIVIRWRKVSLAYRLGTILPVGGILGAAVLTFDVRLLDVF